MWETDSDGADVVALRLRIRRQLRSLIPDSDDLEDVTQDCLVKAWVHRDSLKCEERRSGWVYRLVRNEFVSWLRRRDSRRRVDSEWAAGLGTRTHVSGEDRIVARLWIDRMLQDLGDVDRQILELRYVQGMTSAEVGRTLGLASSSARCRLHRLRGRFDAAVGLGAA
jgi:RNA polymerase sigma-70 factor, ECF subfamily